MGLAVGPEPNAGGVAEGLHLGDVALERGAVDDEERGLGEVLSARKVHLIPDPIPSTVIPRLVRRTHLSAAGAEQG